MKDKRIIQLTNQEFGNYMGLYLAPKDVTDEQFETAFDTADNQDDFDENNKLGIERIFADEIFIKE